MKIAAKKGDIRKAAESVGLPLTDSEITRLLNGHQVSLDKLTLYEYGRLLMKLKGAKTTVIREVGHRKRKGRTPRMVDPPPQWLPVAPGDFNGFHFSSGGFSLGIPIKCWNSNGARCCLYVGVFFVWVRCYALS